MLALCALGLAHCGGNEAAGGIDGERDAAGTGPSQGYDAYIAAFNTGDNAKVRAALHFPFISVLGPSVVIAATPDQYETDFASLRQGGWDHSVIDEFAIIGESNSIAHVDVTFSRLAADGSVLLTGRALYGLVHVANEWKVKFVTGPPEAQTDTAARDGIEAYFAGLTTKDAPQVATGLNFPFVVVNGQDVIVTESANTFALDYGGLDSSGWTNLSLVDVASLGGNAAFFAFQVTALCSGSAGEEFATHSGLYVGGGSPDAKLTFVSLLAPYC